MSFRRLLWTFLGATGLVGVNAAALLVLSPGKQAELQNAYDCFTNGDRPGFARRTYYDDDGGAHRYVVFVPYHVESDSRPPLLVFLHGYSGNGDDGVRHIHECLGPPLWETRNTFPFVVLFPQCPAGSTWDAAGAAGKLTMALVRKTEREYGTDSERIYLTGVSSGGDGTWALASSYADVFAAAVPISGRPAEGAQAKAIADAHLPIWTFYVHGDGGAREEAHHQMQRALLNHGASPLFTEIDGTLSDTWWKHNAWDVAYRNQATYSWLLSHSRSDNAANRGRKFHLILGSDGLTGSKLATGTGWSVDSEGLLHVDAVGANGGPAIMSYDTTFQNYELHFEFRYEAGRQFELFFPARDANGVTLQIALPEYGSGGAYDAPAGKYLQSPAPCAQRGIFQQIWNDVRVRLDGDHLLVDVNGWRLYDLNHDDLLNHTGTFSIRVDPDDASIRWRHFRIREAQ